VCLNARTVHDTISAPGIIAWFHNFLTRNGLRFPPLSRAAIPTADEHMLILHPCNPSDSIVRFFTATRTIVNVRADPEHTVVPENPHDDIAVYTDGSFHTDEHGLCSDAGWSCVFPDCTPSLISGRVMSTMVSCSMDAELFAKQYTMP
jgi:hypothetical protein